MIKLLFTMMIIFNIAFNYKIISQNSFDLRKVNWGMSKEAVIESELPLQCERRTNGDIEYTNITANNLIITLVYEFDNERLSKANYYLSFRYRNVVCTDRVKLAEKLIQMEFIFSNLKEKGYKTSSNWIGYYYEFDKLYPKVKAEKYVNMAVFNLPSIKNKTDWLSADKIDSIAIKKNFYKLYIALENSRTYVSFEFNEFKNNELKITDIRNGNTNDCNFWYFNEILRMQYSPTYNVKKELDKSQF